MTVTFEEFKSYFEFSLEVLGLSGTLGAILYKLDAIHSIHKVIRGRANSADEEVALEAFQQGGGAFHQTARRAAVVLEDHGHRLEAQRLNEMRHQAASRSVSPAQVAA